MDAKSIALLTGGGVLVISAVAFYLIDADPTWLFQDPLASGVLLIAGVGLAYVGWRRGTRSSDEDAE